MLILTRRVGERLMVGDEVVFTILGVKGNQVRVGIAAKDDVEVHREEIWLRIKAEQQQELLEQRRRIKEFNFGESNDE